MATDYIKNNILKNSKQFHSYEEVKLTFMKDNVALDLTGLPITWDFKLGSPDGILVKQLSIGNGLSVITEDSITKLQVATFSIDTPGDIYYDIRMHFPATSKVKYYVGGVVKISPVATKQDA